MGPPYGKLPIPFPISLGNSWNSLKIQLMLTTMMMMMMMMMMTTTTMPALQQTLDSGGTYPVIYPPFPFSDPTVKGFNPWKTDLKVKNLVHLEGGTHRTPRRLVVAKITFEHVPFVRGRDISKHVRTC